MSTAYATLSGQRATRAWITIPHGGIWHADVRLAEAQVLSGPVVLQFAGLTLKGTIDIGGVYEGASGYRVVGGAGGWRQLVAPKHYRHLLGVRLATVVRDAAALVGETVEIPADVDRSIGPAYVREAGSARRVLDRLTNGVWRVDLDGVTRLGARPAGVASLPFDVISYDPGHKLAVLASETPEDLLPGRAVRVTALETLDAVTVVHMLTEGALRTEVWGRL